ncbi:phosphoribosyltransferase [Streptomyces sp. 4N509B]|uniref:phosphoribosyltransferase n=1 Tax=Streptomyces sp. 4N509B TaxID=3457413 RepID=UPI003FD3BD87
MSGSGARRVFQGRRIWRLSPDDFHLAARLLAEAAEPVAPELVVGVERGGRALAKTLARLLGVPHALVTARHNASDEPALPATGRVDLDLTPLGGGGGVPVAGRRLLLADDICGSGATLTALRGRLRELGDPPTWSATLCRNTGAAVRPTWWVWDVADWVAFPWEPPPSAETTPLPAPTRLRSQP